MGWVTNGLKTGVLISAVLAGCQNKLYDENRKLYDENKELRAQNESLKTPPAPAPPPPVVAPPPVVVAPRVVDSQPAPLPPPVAPNKPEQIGGLETTVNAATGNTTVHLPGDVFFDLGQATLKQSGKGSLDKVVAALKNQFADKKVRVEGHTDSTPIRVSKWDSNQQLSEARAKSVKDYLVAHGIEVTRITIKGWGDTEPRGTDNARNRRVEVVVLTGQSTE